MLGGTLLEQVMQEQGEWIPQVLTEIPNPWPGWPPTWEFSDGDPIQGAFEQDQSNVALQADAFRIDTRGVFIPFKDSILTSGTVLRNPKSGIYIRIVGDELEVPMMSTLQIKSYKAYVSSRTIEEQEAKEMAGVNT